MVNGRQKWASTKFLLYFHFENASLRSLFPEHGGVCLCVHVCAQVCTGEYACVHRLLLVEAHAHVHAHMCACQYIFFVCVQCERSPKLFTHRTL